MSVHDRRKQGGQWKVDIISKKTGVSFHCTCLLPLQFFCCGGIPLSPVTLCAVFVSAALGSFSVSVSLLCLRPQLQLTSVRGCSVAMVWHQTLNIAMDSFHDEILLKKLKECTGNVYTVSEQEETAIKPASVAVKSSCLSEKKQWTIFLIALTILIALGFYSLLVLQDNSKLQKQLGEKEQENSQLQKQLGEKEQENSPLQKQLMEKEQENSKLQKQLGEKEQENSQLQKQIREKEQENSQLQKQIREKEQENSQLQKQLGEKEQENSQLQKQLGEKEQENSQLQKQLGRRSRRTPNCRNSWGRRSRRTPNCRNSWGRRNRRTPNCRNS
ncbi:hypothetical protein AGOR_G00187060 [Albula goreensis]|uniref:Uncharacterized protein n=1 Tax=Albula goreensis TaxID=1534307 RepID=A0A8T3CTS3_9TELE|nr:hypothetical protein AGOR_G00187060 [Albula goreensis]